MKIRIIAIGIKTKAVGTITGGETAETTPTKAATVEAVIGTAVVSRENMAIGAVILETMTTEMIGVKAKRIAAIGIARDAQAQIVMAEEEIGIAAIPAETGEEVLHRALRHRPQARHHQR